MMFKILNGQTPDYLSNKFIFRNDTTSYRLRNSEMRLALPQPRTDYVRKSCYSGAALWNSHPTDIRVFKTLGEFKTKLSNFSFEWTNDTASLKSSTFIFVYFHSNKKLAQFV